MKLEDFKEIIAVNPKAKFKFDLGRSCYSFSQYPDVTGVITFDSWGNDSVIWADVAGYDDLLSFNVREIELHKESSEDIETKKLKFPCCVPTSQIKDEATLNKLIDLFVASGYKEPLVSITKEVKYYATIKGVDFTFTQDQLNELVSELGGYQDYE